MEEDGGIPDAGGEDAGVEEDAGTVEDAGGPVEGAIVTLTTVGFGEVLDGSASADLVVVNRDSNSVSVLLNQKIAMIFADGFESGDSSQWSAP